MFKSNLDIFFNSDMVDSKPLDTDYIFINQDQKILTINNLVTPTLTELKDLNLSKFTYLFSFSDRNVFLSNEFDSELFKTYNSNTLREFLYLKDFTQTSIAFTAYHLKQWYSNNKYCGRCGTPFTNSKKERALQCPSCNHLLYPTISPVVIVGIYCENELLLTKYAGGNYNNYALVAGFVEVGENLEQCVAREVFEEVGLKVKNIKYMGSQPWGLTQTLISGFYAEVDGDKTVSLDNNELKEGTWFSREDLPRDNEGNASLTWSLIYNFRENINFLDTYEQ